MNPVFRGRSNAGSKQQLRIVPSILYQPESRASPGQAPCDKERWAAEQWAVTTIDVCQRWQMDKPLTSRYTLGPSIPAVSLST